MKRKSNINFGIRGWMLIIYQFLAFFTFIVFTNFPMNILAGLYGGTERISTIYTVSTLVTIAFQLIMSRFIGKIKNIKVIGVVFGVITMILGFGIMVIPMTQPILWQVCFFFLVFFVNSYCTLFIGILVGQWFPHRKGTVMGITTFAFPIGNGLIGTFAGSVFSPGGTVFSSYLPYFIICLVGLLIGIIFIKDYPEQCGAFRDNDKNISPEVAKNMMEQEIIAKKNSVWTLRNTFKSRDFWFISIPVGALLMCAVGLMAQSMSIISSYPELDFSKIMFGVMIIACLGSWLLGILDTRFGTKKAVLTSVVIMIASGIAGSIKTAPALLVAVFLLSIFMGAASNFTVSSAAQYWRREDFPRVFSYVNPVANILQAVGPMFTAIILKESGYSFAFTVTAVIGVISFILIIAFSSKHVKETDDKYRRLAGRVLDNALADRL